MRQTVGWGVGVPPSWLMDAYMPMDASIKKIVRVVAIVVIAILWLMFLLSLVGLNI